MLNNLRATMSEFSPTRGLEWAAAAGTSALFAASAAAQQSDQDAAGVADPEIIGIPHEGGVNFQPAVTGQARDIHFLDTFLNWISLGIVLLVVVLMLFAAFRFRAGRNKTPARFTHNAVIEVAWTGIPIVILFVIGALSLPVLLNQLEVPESDLTIKATGHQWYWSYSYPDQEVDFDAIMLQRDELEEFGYPDDTYRLATDTAMVVPVDTNVHLLVTGSDVIHAWTVPSFGVKVDAIPGRMNELWFNADTVGTYFGQCSELCGSQHSFMPITVKVLSQEDYDAWLEETRTAQGLPPRKGVDVAAAE